MEAAWAAKYESELAALLADLPEEAPAVAVPGAVGERAALRRGRARPWAPGRAGFSVGWRAPVTLAEAMTDLLDHLAPLLRAHGYDLVDRTRDRAVFSRGRIPGWAIAIAVLTFPVGLLALLVRTRDVISVELVDEGDGTLIYAHGVASLPVRRTFAELERGGG